MTHRVTARPRGRFLLRAVLVAAAAWVLLLTGSAPAWAHAALIGTDPADGALLPAAPATITLTFSEPVTVDDGGVRLLTADGSELPSTTRAIDNRVLITPPALGTGTVIVAWRVTSADSHPIAGGFTFAVGERSAGTVAVPTAAPDTGVQIATAAVQALAYLGVLAACGLIAFDVVVLRGRTGNGRDDDQVRARIRRLCAWCAGGGVAATLVLLPLTELRQRFDPLTGLLDPQNWTAQLGQDAGLTAVLVGAGVLLAWESAWAVNRRTAISAGAALAGCGLALGAFALVGHTRGYGPVALVLTADLLHLTVAAFWLGGLIGLGLLVPAAGREVTGRTSPTRPGGRAGGTATALRSLPRGRVEYTARALARFSTIAAVLVATLAVTGALLAWRVLGSWAALIGTGYGQTLLVKVALVAAAIGVAGHNRYRVLPTIIRTPTPEAGWLRLRRAVTIEAGLLVAVLLVTGWLVNATPTLPAAASAGAATATTPGRDIDQTVPLGSGTVAARITPGAIGVNSLEFTLTDADGRPVRPVTDPEVSVTMPAADVGPLNRPVSGTGPGTYQAVLDLPLSGQWIVTISVRVSEFEQPRATIPMDIP